MVRRDKLLKNYGGFLYLGLAKPTFGLMDLFYVRNFKNAK